MCVISSYTDRLLLHTGMVFTSGREWAEQRKTTIDILKKLGMGKNSLAKKVEEEVYHFVEAIRKKNGHTVDLSNLTYVSISNNICSIVFGYRFQYDDPIFMTYMNLMKETIHELAGEFSDIIFIFMV